MTAILDYHILDERLSTARLNANEALLRTELQSAFIDTGVNVRGQTTLNGVVEIINTQTFASNGIVHEINDILLNRVINNILDEKFSDSSETTTPSPTPTQSATPAPATVSTANVRVAHLAVDAPAINLSINADVEIDDLSYGKVTDFTFVSQGIYTATISSLDEDNEFELDVDLTLLNGDFVTILLSGSLEEDSLEAVILTEDFDDLQSDEARVLVYNALEDAPAISMLPTTDFEIEGVRFAEFEAVDIDGGVYDFSLVETRNNDSILADEEEQSFAENSFYLLLIHGSQDEPELQILETSMEEILRLQSGQGASSVEPTETAEPDVSDETIFEILQSDDTFSIFVRAIEAIRDSQNEDEEPFLAILDENTTDRITLLVPTNQAFTNLRATVGYSEGRLLANIRLLEIILPYHVIEEELLREDFIAEAGSSIQTFLERSGQFFVRAGNDGRIFLNGTIEFEETDIRASNGVIHVVDDVLLPQAALEILGL